MMAGSAALPAYAAGPSRESVPYADSYAPISGLFNTGELRLVPSHTAAVDAAIGRLPAAWRSQQMERSVLWKESI